MTNKQLDLMLFLINRRVGDLKMELTMNDTAFHHESRQQQIKELAELKDYLQSRPRVEV